jgi:hypothetical protein
MFNIPFSLLENFSCGLSSKAEWLGQNCFTYKYGKGGKWVNENLFLP